MVFILVSLRILGGLSLSALSAGLLLLALPPFGIWPFALIGLIPMLFAQYRVLPLRVANFAPAIGIGGFIWVVVLCPFSAALIDPAPVL